MTSGELSTSVNVADRTASTTDDPTLEPHYRVGDLAKRWNLGRETVRKLVMNEPGVVKIRLGRKKAHTIYSVPLSVARRIHTSLLNPVALRRPEPR
jgi:hypothetical protein